MIRYRVLPYIILSVFTIVCVFKQLLMRKIQSDRNGTFVTRPRHVWRISKSGTFKMYELNGEKLSLRLLSHEAITADR